MTTTKYILTALFLLTCSLAALARQSDFSQMIDVQAERSEFDERTGMQTLIGNVVITQGSMKISADRIDVTVADGKLATISGTGSPIRFQQENEQGELVTGECEQITYDARKASLLMIGNARLSQPDREMTGDRIEFDSKTQKVRADGGNNGRVQIRIQPPPEQEEGQ
ncbi:lipopolysaccharide transport periplasmic protein LptA [Granulosicoccaceae sp. 1_MG-2023]|nr:lipopolysaccharide transport periplasmic protein LptA [Granulosicoccaceae sp. 1_MG-2023]